MHKPEPRWQFLLSTFSVSLRLNAGAADLAVATAVGDRLAYRSRVRLNALQTAPPEGLLVAGDPIDKSTVWVRPDLVAEVTYTGWAGFGRLRHAVYLGLREDKPAREVVRDVADPEAPRAVFRPRPGTRTCKGWHAAVPPRRAD